MKKAKAKSAQSWARFSARHSMYFVYDHRNPRIRPLLDSGKYGVVQLICVENTARKAFMAGYRAGRRTNNGGASDV